jgi:hypothetical protein
VANERLIRKLRHVDAVRRDLAAFLDRLGVAIRTGIASLRRGVPVSSQAPPAAEMHVELVRKLDEMHHVVHEARAESVRTLVEDEGLPVSAVAQLMGRPRQLVARLYQHARGGNGRGADAPSRGNGGRPRSASAPAAASEVHRGAGANPRTTIPPAAR